MSKKILDILNHVNQGIIITNDMLEVMFLNKYMEDILDIKDGAFGKDKIYESIPRLNKGYFKRAMKSVIEYDSKFFFSSSMHKNLLSDNMDFNIRLTRFQKDGAKYLIIECTDVTSQIMRINQYKNYNEQLRSLNKELKEKEKQIEKLAYYDGLTGLANRTLFYRYAQQYIYDAERNKKQIGLMFIDIDKFKNINDIYGHMVGDKVLVEVAKLLEASTRKNDIISRHGGDEFLIFLPDMKAYSNYKMVASRIANANKTIKIDDIEIDISLSIGVSFYPKDGTNIDQLISKADKAMYRSKNIGGNKCSSYDGTEIVSK